MAGKQIIVVGAGIIGASIAWHLAAEGAAVTIVEAGEPGGVATPCSFGWINASWGNPEPYFRLRIRAMEAWTRLQEELPALPLSWCGGLLWDMPREGLQDYAQRHGSWGYPVRLVERDEIVRIEPNLADPPELAVYVPAEGVAEPVATARLFVAAAMERGARLLSGVTVAAVARRSGGVAVETGGGPLEADAVVIAAGTATAKLAASVGATVPLVHSPGLLVHSRPFRPLLQGLVMGEAAHIRQTPEGRLVAGADFGGTEVGPDPDSAAATTFAAMRGMLRGAEALEPDFHTIGYRPMAQDGFPVVGEVAENVFVAVTHSGVTLAAGLGRFVADEVLHRRQEPLLAPYRPSRFGDR